MTNPPAVKNTTAFFVQAGIAFGLAVIGVVGGEIYLPISGWPRAFLVLGTVFLVTSSFTLAKVIRDAQDSGSVVSRLDQARLERLLAEFDPYNMPDLTPRRNAVPMNTASYPTPMNTAAHLAPSPPFPQAA